MGLVEITTAVLIMGVVLAVVVYAAARVSERHNPPQGQFVSVDGARLHYIEQGEGDPVVFLHGNVSMVEDVVTSGLFERIAAHHRIVAIDRPGFGHSDRPRDPVPWTAERQAEVIAAAMDQLGISRAVVVGHSWGTLVAGALAQRHPERVRSLVLLGGFYYPEFRVDTMLAVPPATPVVGDILRYTLSPLTGLLIMPLMLRAMFGPAPVPERFRRTFPTSMLLRPWQIRASAEDGVLMNPGAWSLLPGYVGLTMPVYLVAGRNDRIVDTARQSERLAAEISGVRIDIVDGAGHMVHHAAPDRVARLIEESAGRQVDQRSRAP